MHENLMSLHLDKEPGIKRNTQERYHSYEYVFNFGINFSPITPNFNSRKKTKRYVLTGLSYLKALFTGNASSNRDFTRMHLVYRNTNLKKCHK